MRLLDFELFSLFLTYEAKYKANCIYNNFMILFRSKYIIIRAAIINFWLREQFAVVTQRFKVIDTFAIGISSSLVFEIFILILFRCTSNILLIFLPMCER